MTAIDFEKAFDSLNWDFLLKSLETFGFGKSFIAWIKTFYNTIQYNTLYLTRVNILTFYSFLTCGPQK